ncbi:MAG: LptF/LptG family permease [Planctomycetes bacterium]|nr:LptF/LptG family permease [Planctomycetota bacterium]
MKAAVPRTLDLYIVRRFLALYAGNLVCFNVVYVAIDAFENLEKFLERTETFREFLSLSIRYYIAVLPVVFCQLLGPVIALTSGLFSVTLLHRANELVPMLANGRSFTRIFLPILLAGACISLGTFALQELWIPLNVETIREVSGKRSGRMLLENQKFADDKHGILIVMKRYDILERQAEGITVIPTERVGQSALPRRELYVHASSMRWMQPEISGEPYWLMRGARVQEYRYTPREEYVEKELVPPPFEGPAGTVPPLYESLPEYPLETSMIPEDIEASHEDVVYMRLGELRRKMQESADRRWVVKYFSRFSTPLGALVLLLVGLPVITYYGSRNVFFGALVSAVIATGFFVLSSFAADMGLRGFLNASVGAWLGVMSFSALGITLLRYLKS